MDDDDDSEGHDHSHDDDEDDDDDHHHGDSFRKRKTVSWAYPIDDAGEDASDVDAQLTSRNSSAVSGSSAAVGPASASPSSAAAGAAAAGAATPSAKAPKVPKAAAKEDEDDGAGRGFQIGAVHLYKKQVGSALSTLSS